MIDIYYIMLYRFIVVYKPTSNWGAPPCGGMTGMTGMPGFGSLFLIGTDISDGGAIKHGWHCPAVAVWFQVANAASLPYVTTASTGERHVWVWDGAA